MGAVIAIWTITALIVAVIALAAIYLSWMWTLAVVIAITFGMVLWTGPTGLTWPLLAAIGIVRVLTGRGWL